MRIDSWVLMPEHFHLVVMPPPPSATVVPFLWHLKRTFAREVIARWRELQAPVLARLRDSNRRTHFWLPGGDRYLYADTELREKRDYIHWNPVKGGLVAAPEEWAWSSASWYRDRSGIVQVEPFS